MRPIYLDHHATTPLLPEALEAMLPYLRGEFGNAASRTHEYGARAAKAVETARERVAAAIGAADPREITFTSGATESDNLALFGVVEASGRRHVVTGATEHPAVLDAALRLRATGQHDVTILPVDRFGRVAPEQVAEAIRPGETALVSLMLANNEIGTLHPTSEIARVARERGVLVHADASQAVGSIPVDVRALGVDLLSFTAHKLHGPKGAGALWARRETARGRVAPILYGGGHERGLRPGTLNVPAIVGFGVAAERAVASLASSAPRVAALRDRLDRALRGRLAGVALNGHPTERLPGNLNLSFEGVTADAVMDATRELIAVSSGSACASATARASHVLQAIGLRERLSFASIRFGVGRFNTEDEIDAAADAVVGAVERLRAETAALAAPAHEDSRTIEWSR